MSDLTPLAVSTAPVLRALDRPIHVNLTELAAYSGRKVGNMNATLKSMAGEGLIELAEPPFKSVLTPAGRRALAAIERADGAGPMDLTGLERATLDRFAFNPHNPRKVYDPGAIEGLADTIVEKGDLLAPLRVYAPGSNGVYMLAIGERRLRACFLLQAQGRLPALLAEEGVPFVEISGAYDDAVLDALIENGAREDLDPLDDAEALLAAMNSGRFKSARELAKAIGRAPADSDTGVRAVQERIKVARDASEEAKREYRAGRMAWDALMKSVREAEPRAAHGLTDRQLLIVAEAADYHHRFGAHPDGQVDVLDADNHGGVEVVQAGLGFSYRDGGCQMWVSERARELLRSLDLSPDQHATDAIRQARLFTLRRKTVSEERANAARAVDGYITPWLARPTKLMPPAPAPAPSAPPRKSHATFPHRFTPTPAQTLIIAEIAHKLTSERRNRTGWIEVRASAMRDANVETLYQEAFLKRRAMDGKVGRYEARLYDNAIEWLEANPVEVGDVSQGYKSAWLNPEPPVAAESEGVEEEKQNCASADRLTGAPGESEDPAADFSRTREALTAALTDLGRRARERFDEGLGSLADLFHRDPADLAQLIQIAVTGDVKDVAILDAVCLFAALSHHRSAHEINGWFYRAKEHRIPSSDTLLGLCRGDRVFKYEGGATTYELLELDDTPPGKPISFRCQPYRRGKKYGSPERIALTSIAGICA